MSYISGTSTATTSNAAEEKDAVLRQGICLLLLSLFCLGTWPALLRVASSANRNHNFDKPPEGALNFRFVVSHVYMDYAVMYFFISSVLLPVILSDQSAKTEEGNCFPLVLVTMIGGALLSLGNLSLQWSTVVYGAPITTVVAIQASLTVAIGTSINYLLEPSQTPRPIYLAMGVGVFGIAIGCATITQLLYTHDKQRLVEHRYHEIELEYGSAGNHGDVRVVQETSNERYGNDGMTDRPSTNVSEPTTDGRVDPRMGLWIATLGGLCFGFFSPAFNIAVHDTFDWTSQGTGLPVVKANAWFAFSFVLTSLCGNVYLLHRGSQHSSLRTLLRCYLFSEPFKRRALSLVAGLICAIGNSLQFQGGKMVGYATSDLVQAYPLVSTLWDIFFFGEFLPCSVRLQMWMAGMYTSYIVGVILLAASSFHER